MVKALLQTVIMVIIPLFFSFSIGTIFGYLLYTTKKGGINENKIIYLIINGYVNIIRSMPYIIFVIFLIPITRYIFKTAFGVIPSTFPISLIGIALYSRFVEQSFNDVNLQTLDLARGLRATKMQVLTYFLIPESIHSLVLGLTSTTISIISYSTVMGIVGGGGIGDYALRYGYYEYNYKKVLISVLIMSCMVFVIQILGNTISKKLDKRKD